MTYGAGWLDLLKEGRLVDAGKSLVHTVTPAGVTMSLVMDTRAWDTQRVVRTYGDFLAFTRYALNDVGTKVPALKAAYSAYARAPERVMDGQGNPLFPSSATIPQLFARLRDMVSASSGTKKLVVAKAAEYYKNVEQVAQQAQVRAPTSAPVSAGSFQPSAVSVPPAALDMASAPVEPFYRKAWFPPVATLSAIALAALVLLPKRS